jgi:endonuclease/exonuclease/phosphatase family metal-dependent hydrolase
VLLVTVRVPGAASPVDIVTTHLNSRRSSGVSDARSLYAYQRQVAAFSEFLNRWHDPSYPLIAAGDFNVGTASPRWHALRAQIAFWPDGALVRNAISQVAARSAAEGIPMPRDTAAIMRRGADWQFFTSGLRARISAIAVSVPFGREADGSMLSDHIGYVSQFSLDRRGA